MEVLAVARRAPRVLVVDGDGDTREALSADLSRHALPTIAAPLEAATTAAVRHHPDVLVVNASETWTRPAHFASLRTVTRRSTVVAVAHVFDVARILADAAAVATLPADGDVVAGTVLRAWQDLASTRRALGSPAASGVRPKLASTTCVVVGPRGRAIVPWLSGLGHDHARWVVAHSALRAAIVLDALASEGRAASLVVHPSGDGEYLRRVAAHHRARVEIVE